MNQILNMANPASIHAEFREVEFNAFQLLAACDRAAKVETGADVTAHTLEFGGAK